MDCRRILRWFPRFHPGLSLVRPAPFKGGGQAGVGVRQAGMITNQETYAGCLFSHTLGGCKWKNATP